MPFSMVTSPSPHPKKLIAFVLTVFFKKKKKKKNYLNHFLSYVFIDASIYCNYALYFHYDGPQRTFIPVELSAKMLNKLSHQLSIETIFLAFIRYILK